MSPNLIKTFALTILLSSFIFTTLQHQCIHDSMEHDIKIGDSAYSLYGDTEARMLQSYNSIRIISDASTLGNTTDTFKQYITQNIMPIIVNYFQAVLQVPAASSNLKAGGYSTLCDVAVPSYYNTDGVSADLVAFLRTKNDPNSSYVASATACLLEATTKRPVFSKIVFNTGRMVPTNNTAKRERDILTVLHEFTHALGFSSSLYKYYIDPSTGKVLTGHITYKKVYSFNQTVLNLAPLTPRLQKHFGCNSMTGAYIENEGGSGSAGSHFERRLFYNEYMTASAILDTRVTEFSLAVLEGSGWYKVDYSLADTMTYGKDKGCSFIDGDCFNKNAKTANFDEYCSVNTMKTCSWTGRAGGACDSFGYMKSSSLPAAIDWFGDGTLSGDPYSDNCPTVLPYTDLDCEDPNNGLSPTISGESYQYGSKCFMGTLYPSGQLASAYPFCFKSACKKTDLGANYVEVTIGSTTVKCNQEGSISVPGYRGALNCPNPDKFCYQSLNEGFCRRGCSARGVCVNMTCQCADGWTGDDCSIQINTKNCSQCQNDPFKKSCFGDTCVCNEDNIYCMCALGLKTGDACENVTDSYNYTNQKISPIGQAKPTTTGDSNGDQTSQGFPIIIVVIGGVAGIIVILLAFFLRKYAKTFFKAFKGLRSKNAQPAKPPAIKTHQAQKNTSVIQIDSENASPKTARTKAASLYKEGPLSAQSANRFNAMDSFDGSPIKQPESPKPKLRQPSIFSHESMARKSIVETRALEVKVASSIHKTSVHIDSDREGHENKNSNSDVESVSKKTIEEDIKLEKLED